MRSTSGQTFFPDELLRPSLRSGDRSRPFQATPSSVERRPTSVGSGSDSSARQRVLSPPVPTVTSSGSQLLQCSSPSADTVHLFFVYMVFK